MHSVQIVSYLVSLGANVNMQVCLISFCFVRPFSSFHFIYEQWNWNKVGSQQLAESFEMHLLTDNYRHF